jgi:hypothetical protein
MLEVCFKTVLFTDCGIDGQEKVLVAFYAFAARAAYEMVVVPFFGVMIDKFIIDFTFKHASKFFQKLQGTVDGRFVNAGGPGLDVIKDIICGQVCLRIMNDVQDETALRRELQTFFFKCDSATHCQCTQLQL